LKGRFVETTVEIWNSGRVMIGITRSLMTINKKPSNPLRLLGFSGWRRRESNPPPSDDEASGSARKHGRLSRRARTLWGHSSRAPALDQALAHGG
jgi:hypothetical protein